MFQLHKVQMLDLELSILGFYGIYLVVCGQACTQPM
jgi:hypothetical protein